MNEEKICPFMSTAGGTEVPCTAKCGRYLSLSRKDKDGNLIKDEAGNVLNDGACVDSWNIIVALERK